MTSSPIGLILVIFLLISFSTAHDLPHRHRHSKGHSEYNLDRLMNRLDDHVSTSTPETTTEPNQDPGNSLWDDDLTLGTVAPLDADRWDKIIQEKQRKDKDVEEPEEGFQEKEQGDNYKPWVSHKKNYR